MIRLGSITPSNIMLGTQQVSRVMLGAQEVWSAVSMDADAAAYIAAVEAALGSAITSTQSAAIDAFIVGEKAASRWSAIKRFYLPIWANENANKIDMVTRATGAFVGGVAHSSGYVRFNGTTGYFIDNDTCTAHGMGIGNAHVMALIYDNPATGSDFARIYGAYETTDATTEITAFSRQSNSTLFSRCYGVVAPVNFTSSPIATHEGIFLTNRNSTTDHRFKLLKAAGLLHDGNSGVLNEYNAPAAKMGWATRYSQLNGPNTFYPADFGAMSAGVSIGENAAQNDYLTAVKTLWETCTGLTLP